MSASAKQKNRQPAITRTTAPDALIRYPLGLLILVMGLAALAALISGTGGGIAFRLIREKVFGLTGSLPWPLPFLMIWTGGAMMLSCYHAVNWRGILFSWIFYLSVLALMTMLTYVNGVGPLMSYIRQYNTEQRPWTQPASFGAYLARSYEWGVNGRYPYCGGGALSMLLAYPAYQLFHHVLGIIFLFAVGIASLLAALHIRVGTLIRGASDWMEKLRTGRPAMRKERENIPAPMPAQGETPMPAAGQAAYSYETYAQPEQAYAGAQEDYMRPQPEEPFSQPEPVSSRFVPVGDGNTLYNEEFVLHPKKEKRASKKRPEPVQTVLDDGSREADAVPAQAEAAPQPAPAQPVPTEPLPEAEAVKTVPMTEEDFMPPDRAMRKKAVREPEAEETVPPAPRQEKPAVPAAAAVRPPVPEEEPAPWESDEGEDEDLSDWQKQLRDVSRGLFSSQPVKLQDKKPAREVVDVDPAVRMDAPVRIQPREKTDRAPRADRPAEAPAPARMDNTPAQKTAKVENPFANQPYTPPPINFLSEPKVVNREESNQEDVHRAQQIERTLSTFNIQTKVCEITHGPAITRFALKIAEGIKVKQVVGMLDNIALEMGSDRLRIEAPIPGTSYIGIEVPNSKVSSVTLREVLDSDAMRANTSPLIVALGKDIAGKPILCDLSRMPHLLIAGATGSGKSVCINSIVCSLLYRASPADVRLIMVDPKQVELQVYNGIPHLLIPVISDPKKASSALNWVVNEMFERYGKFSAMGVRNLEGYNKKNPKEKKLPNIVVIIDEMADLMEVCRKDVEESVRRLAALARAAGIYMVLATQRPSVDVITGVIKNNIPSRIAFTVSSGVDSRTIIDVNGAEKLMGKGDMLYQPTGASKPTRVQGCFVSDDEVARITENIVSRYRADYNEDIQMQMEERQESTETRSSAEETRAEIREGEFNDLLTEAVRMAVEDGQTSISMLQRTLRIGYARAGRLVDEMTKKGLISEAEGSKPRKVLITREQFADWLRENAQNAS